MSKCSSETLASVSASSPGAGQGFGGPKLPATPYRVIRDGVPGPFRGCVAATPLRHTLETAERAATGLGGVASAPLRDPHEMVCAQSLPIDSVRAKADGTKVAKREPKMQIFAENRRFSQIDRFSWKFKQCAENRRFLQKTEDFRRKTQETADGVRHLRSVTFSSALLTVVENRVAWRLNRFILYSSHPRLR